MKKEKGKNSPSLRKLAAQGLIPLSFLTAIITNDPAARAVDVIDYSPTEENSTRSVESSSGYTMGEKLHTPTMFNNHMGQWVGRDITTVNSGHTPALREYFLGDDNIMYRTTVTSYRHDNNDVSIDTTTILPEKIARSVRGVEPSLPYHMVFDYFVDEEE